jgi:20S proteasome subunit beta 6
MQASEPIQAAKGRWDPYVNHGGTALAVVGTNFVVVASDTRLSSDYSIHSRHKTRIFRITSKAIIVATGFQADLEAFVSRVRIVAATYAQEHFKELSVESLSVNVSNILYSKRFFPYYINVLVAGIGKNGEGLLFGYDPVGTLENLKYDVNGSGSPLAMPILDCAFGTIHRNTVPFPYPSLDEAKQILRDAITSAAERDIYTGDALQIATVTADGLKIEEFPLPAH